MKKNNGFTLIELLAVIVILAIIALIATPIIIGLIDNARKEAFKDSAYGLVKAGEIYYSKNLLTKINEEVTFTYNDGVESSSVSGKKLDYNSSKPNSGTVIVNSEGKVAVAIHNGAYCAKKGYFDSEIILTDEVAIDCNIPLYTELTLNGVDPELTTGMIPVKWDGTNWVKANVIDKWYDYNSKEWANAVTVTSTNRDTYLNAEPGSVIPISDINTMWVWVPRYKYAIPTGIGERSINIVFESKTTTKSNGNAIDTNYLTHPAFTFGTTEVNGIWIGKFETTGEIGNPTILPNTPSLRNQTVKAMYDSSRAMQNNTTYGFSNDGNIHMAKDSEWGAVAYLSHSQYGINSEIFINPSSSKITGRGGNQVSQFATMDTLGTASDTLYSYDGKQCNTKTGYVCTGALQSIYGMASSTTGNIYGVYDISGGSWEYVMGMYRPTDATSVTDSSGFGATTTNGTLPTSEYWDRYTDVDVSTACNSGICYGSALSETSGWYSDCTYFVNATYPWSIRGGYYNNVASTGAFYFYGYTGGAGNISSFRVVQLRQ